MASRGSWRLPNFSILHVDVDLKRVSVWDFQGFFPPPQFLGQRAVDSPVVLHQQSEAAIVPRSLPQTGEDEQQELEHRTAALIRIHAVRFISL